MRNIRSLGIKTICFFAFFSSFFSLGPSQSLSSDKLVPRGILDTIPSGTYGAATGLAIMMNTPALIPQVNGFTAPNQLYLLNDVGSVAQFSANYGSMVDDFHPKPEVSAWSTDGAVFATRLSPQQVANVNEMIYKNVGLSNRVGPLALSSDGMLGNITAISIDGITVGNWMAVGNSRPNQVPKGRTLQINPQSHIWAQNSNVYLKAGTMTERATALEGDLLNDKGPSGISANVVGVTMNCHDTGNRFGCNTGYIASGTDANPFATGFVSSKNKIGYQSAGDTEIGFVVQHTQSDPPFGFVSFQNGGHPFAYNPGGAGYAWSVGSNGGMSIGNSGTQNGFAIAVNRSGVNPQIAAACVDKNCDFAVKAQGSGSVSIISGLTVAGGVKLNGTLFNVSAATGGRATKYVCADDFGNWFAQVAACH